MRYIQNRTMEIQESRIISDYFGMVYAPFGNFTIDNRVRITSHGTNLVETNGEILTINPETNSWAFLNRHEASIFCLLDGITFETLSKLWPSKARTQPSEFLEKLFRRGLIQINGYSAIDRSIFEHSQNLLLEKHLVELLVTEKCNLACIYCLAGSSIKNPSMTEEIAIRAIDSAFMMSEAHSITFEFSGGEPFLQFELLNKLTEYIRSHSGGSCRDVYITVQTNATLLTQKHIEWLKNNKIYIGISLDGSADTQNFSRPMVGGCESYERTMRGLKLLKKNGVPFGVLIVLSRANVAKVRDLIDFLVKNEINSFKINPIAYLGTGKINWDYIGITTEEIIKFFKEFASIIVADGSLLLEDNLASMLWRLTSKLKNTRCIGSHCGAGITFQAINPKGDIYPCGRATQISDVKIGNIFDGFNNLSAPGINNKNIREISDRVTSGIVGCSNCYYRNLCQAGCPVLALEKYGTIQAPSPECNFFREMYPFLMKWLCFDYHAFRVLNTAGYFGKGAELVCIDFI